MSLFDPVYLSNIPGSADTPKAAVDKLNEVQLRLKNALDALEITTEALHQVTLHTLTSITGIIYSAPNATIPTGSETAAGHSTAGVAGDAGFYTLVQYETAITNNRLITKVGIYATESGQSVTFKLAERTGAGAYTLTDLQSAISKTITGYQEFTLTTPYWVPASGSFYLAVYVSGTANALVNTSGSTHRAYKAGSQTGAQTGFTEDAAEVQLTYRYITVPTPANLYAAYTNAIQLNTSSYASIDGVTATQVLNGASIWHAASENKGNSAEKWWVYLSSVWRDIAELVSGTWYYKNAGGTWSNASPNTRLGALSQAFGVAQNQMSATALAAITEAQWNTIFVAGTLDLAFGLQASGTSIPTLDKWAVSYTLANEYTGVLRKWTGSAFAKGKLKVDVGGSFVTTKPTKWWNGSAFVTMDTTGV